MARTQAERWLGVETPLGTDVLLMRRMRGRESLAAGYEYELELESEKHDLALEEIIGESVSVRATLSESRTRWFSGVVREFRQLPAVGRLARYHAVVVPWTWLLSRHIDCRLFQNMTAPDIIGQVLKQSGFGEFEPRLTHTYPTREYCVQYRESDLRFVSRLMESEGLYAYFRHEQGRSVMVIVDSPSAHEAAPGAETFPARARHDSAVGVESAWGLSVSRHFETGEVILNDFNFKTPRKSLRGRASLEDVRTKPGLHVFDYPGGYDEAANGEHYSRIRAEELVAAEEVLTGTADVKALACGFSFTLKETDREDVDRVWLPTEVEYELDSTPFDPEEGSDRPAFLARFAAIDSTRPFRPPLRTPRAMVGGPQTAIVVGPSGQEIYTDEHGRVKVKFHWDRYAKGDQTSSCWIRVSQPWAGSGWGGIQIPRIGQEVIVDFLEGDPDRPIITGRVYNGDNTVPYELPANATISTVKSNSSKGGEGFNELRFEDKKGEEQIFVHGEKNADIRIKNDEFEWIGRNRHLVVKKDQIEHVENNREDTVDNDHKEKIGNDRNLKVVGKEAKEVGKTLSLVVKDDVIEVFKKNQSTQVTKDLYIKAANICIEATTNITIKVGQSHIAIEASGIKIGTTGEIKVESTGPTEIKSTAPLKLESSAKADLKSPMSTVAGDGMLTLKGGLVKIN